MFRRMLLWGLLPGALVALALTGCDGTTIGQGGATQTNLPARQPSTTTLVSSAASLPAGQTLQLTATVTPATAVGYLTLEDSLALSSTQALGNAVATFTFAPMIPGTHVFEAQYGGYDGEGYSYAFDGSASAPLEILVNSTNLAGSCGLGTAALALSSGTTTTSGLSYSATGASQSAVCVQNSGTSATLNNAAVVSSAYAAAANDPSGIGAAVLAYGVGTAPNPGATLTLNGGSITMSGAGAPAAFASGAGSVVTLNNTVVQTQGTGAAGVGAGKNGVLAMTGGSITTNGASGVLVEGSGTVNLSNVAVSGSPYAAIYNSGITFTNPEAALRNSPTGSLSMTGGSYTPQASPAFSANEAAQVTLNHVALTLPALVFQSNGSPVTLNLINQNLSGGFEIEYIASAPGYISLTLSQGSVYTGTGPGTGGNVTVDATSQWLLTASATVRTLTDPAGIIGGTVTNIVGNGFDLGYCLVANPGLQGLTYTLVGGGRLMPVSYQPDC